MRNGLRVLMGLRPEMWSPRGHWAFFSWHEFNHIGKSQLNVKSLGPSDQGPGQKRDPGNRVLEKILSHREVYFPRGVRRHVFCSECNRAVSSSSDQSDAHKLILIPGAQQAWGSVTLLWGALWPSEQGGKSASFSFQGSQAPSAVPRASPLVQLPPKNMK